VKKPLIAAALVVSLSAVAVACDDGDDATPSPEPAAVETMEAEVEAVETMEAEVEEAEETMAAEAEEATE
jgi:hypothetical protein